MPKTTEPPADPGAAAPADTGSAPAPRGTRYRVALQCPTPIPHPVLEVEADDDDEAWQKFCAANGISDSEHKRTILKMTNDEARMTTWTVVSGPQPVE